MVFEVVQRRRCEAGTVAVWLLSRFGLEHQRLYDVEVSPRMSVTDVMSEGCGL